MHRKKPSNSVRRTSRRRSKAVGFEAIAKTLRELDRRDPPVLVWPAPKSRAGRPMKHSNINVLERLLHSWFDGIPLQTMVAPEAGGSTSNHKTRPLNGPIYHKLEVWTEGDRPALDRLWEAYLRAIPTRELEAWYGRLLGLSAEPTPGSAQRYRYVNGGAPARLLGILIRVCSGRGVKLG